MSDIFGQADALATARRAPAEAPPSSFSESLSSSFEVTMETGRSISAAKAIFDAHEAYAREVLDAGGPALPNPYALAPGETPQAEAFVTERVNKARETNPDIPVFDPEVTRAQIGRNRAAARARRWARRTRKPAP